MSGVTLRIENKIAHIEWDLEGENANKLNTRTMTAFRDILDKLNSGSEAQVAIISSKKSKIFMAGADIDEIKTLKSRADFEAAVQAGQDVMNRIEDLKIPVIAAIHGACVGGGCEMVLACDYRLASSADSTKIGLPEVKLGIIPGFGGCVRLPRVVGVPNALDIILSGKTPHSSKALKMGLVDEVVHEQALMSRAIQFAEDLIAGAKLHKRRKAFQSKSWMDRFLNSSLGAGVAFKKAKSTLMEKTHGHYPAPLKALEVISQTWAMGDRIRALEIEKLGFSEVAATDVSRNLISLFFWLEDIKKQTGVPDGKTVQSVRVERLGVLGAGTMGGGIAYVSADKGIEVRLKDVHHKGLELAYGHARALWDKLVQKRRLSRYQLKQKMSLISGGLDYAGFKRLDLIVEAVVEDMSIKKKVIAEVANHAKEDAVVVTNTSSLSVSEMSEAHPRPQNFAGLHFFNPVDKMPLVEVIRGPKTSDETVATLFAYSKAIGKTPVVVKDGPGFLVNRILLPYMVESTFLLSEGYDLEKIDSAFVKTFGMPMGPFELMDEVGLDVCTKVAKIFKASFGERIEVPSFFDKIAKENRLGKKTMAGFYVYEGKSKKKKVRVNGELLQELGLQSGRTAFDEQLVLERCVYSMVNEATRALLEDRIVDTPQSVDLAMIMGTGFPPFRGGLLKYADTVGLDKIATRLAFFAGSDGKRLKPCAELEKLASRAGTFYSPV